jgi:hypothetical protein
MRTTESNGTTYISVTSAMRIVKKLLDEPEDYYGPLAAIHAAEGTGCHAVCLDWLAVQHGFLPEMHTPQKPLSHSDEPRWYAVLDKALYAFQEFVEFYKVEPIGIEQADFSKAYGLVGHIDLPAYFTIPGRRRMKGPIDLKFTSAILESHRLQTRCYGRLDGMLGSQLGGIFQCNRDTGAWKFEPVDLTKNLDDVAAVSYAAKLWAWGDGKKNV